MTSPADEVCAVKCIRPCTLLLAGLPPQPFFWIKLANLEIRICSFFTGS